jgi:glycyl-tRNA synthetase beta chain
VIRARLADAAFFHREDLRRPLEECVAELEGIVFEERLGTVAAKGARVEDLVERLSTITTAEADVRAWAMRAAHLAKADLVSHVVVEFPALQGVMGAYYALAGGEAPEVAQAIREHYQPRFSGDALPASQAGKLVSMADKLDTMCGIFAIGMAPTGSADPYALRRGAIGILGTILDGEVEFSLDAAIAAALEGYRGLVEGAAAERAGAAVKEFLLARFESVLKEHGHAFDTVAAVLAVAGDDPLDAARRAAALTPFRASGAIGDLSVAFTRARNLCEPGLGTLTDRDLMGVEELALADSLADAGVAAAEALARADYAEVLAVLSGLRGPIDAFFEAVLVMDPDDALRANRLRLLNGFVQLFERVADFGALAG